MSLGLSPKDLKNFSIKFFKIINSDNDDYEKLLSVLKLFLTYFKLTPKK